MTARVVEVRAELSDGDGSGFALRGLSDQEVAETRDRIRAAIVSSGLPRAWAG